MPELSIIAPLLNEEKNVQELYARLKTTILNLNASHEIIFVDDGSTDNTLLVVEKIADEDPNFKYISFSRNFGHQQAMFAGLEKCTGERIVFIDGDLQDPPELIESLYHKMNEGFDVVYAKRMSRQGESFFKLLTAKIFYRLLNKITSINIPLDTGDYRIISRRVAVQLLKMNDHIKFLRGQIAWLGFREEFVSYNREKRKNGKSNFPYTSMFRFAFDGITGFSTIPLKIASILGIIISIFAFLLIIYVILAKVAWGQTITGWASIMVTILFLGGIQLLSLGIIGEYISRINDSTRNRQLYIIDKTNLEKTT